METSNHKWEKRTKVYWKRQQNGEWKKVTEIYYKRVKTL